MINAFKRRLLAQEVQYGLWLGLADAYCAELAANAGFDWLLIDGEHAPNDLRSTLGQLQAIAPYAAQPIVRPVCGDAALIKQLLDLGAQTLLVPMVETADQAKALVRAVRYPPAGIRGMGSGLARASRWNSVEGYVHQADEQICLLVQVESLEGLANLELIAAVEGVDGVFIGPADLSAAMGYRGNPGHPAVVSAIDDAIGQIVKAGKAAGVLTADEGLAKRYRALGATFVAVGVDTAVLMRGLKGLIGQFRAEGEAGGTGAGY
ncbi:MULTISPECIES: 4-hydroxy-2-oxoheptanedioate aldolase [unclassified Pseudomonas]|uniref:4-hydroxy-2-oxoheptanedioate aldolase n=1 Tax=unclassified Pseudomonas TaxID=196821 RepID=UPI000BC97142|nr:MULTISPECIES: 4-hydroxy-2-oxoheptanedioate aldolase [unclassified Pseudomonas]PVZ19711.1 4-hydroxy-2-oxoheptanedioate aldolase [Pseudomonas sp. URIL14HWK12:I12]PVZ22704.1 4-hydroxy-2-oxoheptanedioate aldolase [Pseudomonas sp. URIL14HWK12:I10]PVZ37666.1 4-hydroxy-2-oxoheptanedioate aldolase [Pseudomonas sp. URIL14HWK12:I11]SNZ15446.1 2,4-dihydroxyhept-2-enedioate aldolase [Pseudomonas sp. URIL14HWK12:I9]